MVGMMKSFLIRGEGVWTAFVNWRCRFSWSLESLEMRAPFNSRSLGSTTRQISWRRWSLGQRSVRSSLGVGVSEWDQRLAKTLLPTKGKGEKIVGAYAPYTPLSTRLQGIGNAKQHAQGYLQDAGNAVTTLETCACEVHHYTSKMQSDTRIANRPLPQQRQVKTATHKMQDDQVVVSTVRSSRRVSIFCQRLDRS